MGRGLNTEEHGDWSCYVCDKVRERVVEIPTSPKEFYCEECLFNAVRDGDLTFGVSSRCDNCEVSADEETIYCRDCARDRWDLHDYDECDHDYCHDECGPTECERCYNGVAYYLCEEHLLEAMRTNMPCLECGDAMTASDFRCGHCRRQVANAQAAQSVTTTDGREMTFDDGVVVRWEED